MLAPEEQTSHIHPEVIDDSTTLLVDEMTTKGPTSSSARNSEFIKQWIRHVQDVSEAGPSISAALSQVNIQELYGLQMEEVYSISQQLLTSQLPNEDYAAIHSNSFSECCWSEGHKVIEANNGENPEKWLDANAKVSMPKALQSLRDEYLTYVGPICKDSSPLVIADVVNEAYKSQIKANHQMGKGISKELNSIESNTDIELQEHNQKVG